MAREALAWALQRSRGTGLREVPGAAGVSASSSLEMSTEGRPHNRKQTMAPDPRQASRRHGPDTAPMRAARWPKGHVTCTRRLVYHAGVLCLWYLHATSQTDYVRTPGKAFTEI